MRKALLALALVTLVAVSPLVAYADSATPLNCTATLGVTNPGRLKLDDREVQTHREQTQGALACDVAALSGTITTVHDSEITVNPTTGSFTGELKGKFTLVPAAGPYAGKQLKGDMKAAISGVVVAVVPGSNGPVPVHQVTDIGAWELNGGKLQGKGAINVTLVGIVGIPAAQGGLAGGGTFTGKLDTKNSRD